MAAIFNCDLTEEGVLDLYVQSLSGIDTGLLNVTVSELMREVDWMPRPAAILRKAKEIDAASSDKPAEEEHWRKDRYDCLLCRDTGYVTVWTRDALKWALHQAGSKPCEKEPKRRLSEAAAKCTCSRGKSRGGNATEYNDAGHVRIEPGSTGQKVDQLMVWAKQWKPSNYVEALEAY
jgi:hypothetical protein